MSGSLRALALRWIAWASIARAGQDGLRLAGRLVLARLLMPEAFGLFTLAYALSVAVALLLHLETHTVLVQRRDLPPGTRSTAYWSLGALGGLGGLAVLALGAPLGALVGEPRIAPLLAALSVHLALDGFTIVPRALIVRDLGFRRLARVDLTGEVLATAAAVGAALAGAGPFSMVVHLVVLDLTELVMFHRLAGWRPRRHWRWAELAELARLGTPLVGKRAIDYAVAQGDRLLVGTLLGPATLGLYALALRLVKGLSDAIGAIFEGVGFPAFARARGDLERSRRGFLAALRAQTVMAVPLLLGIALTAHELVPLALGPAWAGAVPLVQILAARALFSSLRALPRAVLLAHGASWLVLALSACSLAAFGAGWLAGSRWGVAGVATGGAAAAALILPVALALMRTRLRVSLAEGLRAVGPALLGGACLAAAVIAAASLLGPAMPAALRAAVLVAAGAAAYTLALAPWLAREGRDYVALWRSPRAPAPIEERAS